MERTNGLFEHEEILFFAKSSLLVRHQVTEPEEVDPPKANANQIQQRPMPIRSNKGQCQSDPPKANVNQKSPRHKLHLHEDLPSAKQAIS